MAGRFDAAAAGLPVADALPELLSALADGGRAVLVAPPGAGKTTLVPLALLDQDWLAGRRIVLLEPRRIAARAAARRMASMLGEEVGGTVGYAMRLDSRQSERTRILVVTEGVFTRMVLDDPELTGIGAVLFDEFHERSLDADFGLALTLDVAGALRPDLRLLVMSATLDAARVAALLGDTPVIESKGRAFPVEIRYEPADPKLRMEDAVSAAIRQVLRDEEGSILAFLPGQREIERVVADLRERVPVGTIVAPLYGALDQRAQDEAIRPVAGDDRKVVLATPVAETSLTIDGVRIVVDSGYARVPVLEPATGMTRLQTARVSLASADQRAGRAGRTEPGIAIRLWRPEQNAALRRFSEPEILQSDLSRLVLDCASFGITDPAELPFLDAPPAPALNEAKALLRQLGAIDDDAMITPAGEAMRALGLPVRLAAMVVRAAEEGRRSTQLAAELATLLTERGLGGSSADLERRLQHWRTDRSPRARDAARYAKRLIETVSSPSGTGSNDVATPGAILLLGFADRLARQRGQPGRYVLANGRGAMLDETDPLAAEGWLCVADLTGAPSAARILAAAPVSEVAVAERLASTLERRRTMVFDEKAGAIRVRERSTIGAITLSERPVSDSEAGEMDAALIEAIREKGLGILPWSEGAERLRDRLGWLGRTEGEPWPSMEDAALLDRLQEWITPFLDGSGRLAPLKPQMADALRSLVPFELHRQIDVLAPSHFEAPTGSRVPINYRTGEYDQPRIAIRVQELFGLTMHPTIGRTRRPLKLDLLSPAHRPLQTTTDLPGFWSGSWVDVRAEMRGRYPKHSWPADPSSAEPTRRTKRASSS